VRCISKLTGALLAALTIGISAAPVAGAGTVRPLVECVFAESDGSDTAVWGYENNTGAVAEVAIGTRNKFDPKPEDRGQPAKFEVGRKYNVFTTHWEGTNLTWKLDGNADTASRNSKKCDAAAVPQGSDSPQAVALIAAAAGVIVVGGATSGWMVRRRRNRAA
jgi:hypothetical protein